MPDPSMFDMFSLLNQSINKGFKSLISHPFDGGVGRKAGGSGSSGVGGSNRLSVAGSAAPVVGPDPTVPLPSQSGTTPSVGAGYNPLTDPYWGQRTQEFRNEYINKIESGEFAGDLAILTGDQGALDSADFRNLFTDSEYVNAAVASGDYSQINMLSGLTASYDAGSRGGTIQNDYFKITLADVDDSASIQYKLPDGTWSKRYRRKNSGEVAELNKLFGTNMFALLNNDALENLEAYNTDDASSNWKELRQKNLESYFTKAGETLNKSVLLDKDGNYLNVTSGDYKKNFYQKLAKDLGIKTMYERTSGDSALRERFLNAITSGGAENYNKLTQGKVDEGTDYLEKKLYEARTSASTNPYGVYNSVINRPLSSSLKDDEDEADMLSVYRV